MKLDISKEWCLAAAAREAECGNIEAGDPSGIPLCESQGQSSALAVAGGSLPVWSAGLFALADKWDDRARQADLLAEEYPRRGAEFRESAIHWRFAANELRAEIVAATVRQPEDNHRISDTKE